MQPKIDLMRLSWYWISIIILGFSLQYCANPIAPTGGPRDETPPQLDSTVSTSNYQTNFQKQDIQLTFDEWIVLKDVFNQVVISPPLENQPEIFIRKKTVYFEFADEEVLKDEVTYTINFGEAIEDLTEGNPADNLRFVFSTGDFIDSLSIQGIITDAKTGEPLEGVLFNMYDEIQDTVVRTKRPFYFAKTDKDGRFRVDNVKSDTFKLFALKDANLNYLFDVSSEAIGFLDTTIILPRDISQNLQLKLFTEEPVLNLISAQANTYGVIRLAFSKEVPKMNFRSNLPDVSFVEEYKNDSLLLWYSFDNPGNWQLFVEYDTLINDTISIDSLSQSSFLQANSLKWVSARSSSRASSLIPGKALQYELNHPLTTISEDLINLTADTTRQSITPTVSIDTSNNRILYINYPWREGMTYQLEILPGALTDIYGLSLTDTLSQVFLGAAQKDFGTLNLQLTDINPDTAYVVDLFSGGTTLVERMVVSGESEYSRVFQNLSPGKYEVHVTIDLNQNGRWDTGNYDLKRQPEPYLIKEVEQLRANWEIEANISLNEFN